MSDRAAELSDIAQKRATDRPGDISPFRLGLLLRRAHDRAASALAAAVRPHGIELRHFAVLIELANESPISQRDLAARVGSDKTSIVRIIDDLEELGYAVRRPFPGDRRVKAIELTPAGLKGRAAGPVAAGVSRLPPRGVYPCPHRDRYHRGGPALRARSWSARLTAEQHRRPNRHKRDAARP
jgi:MarR family transcriptional regulator, lower aerobic nicotinate degradation pathway regulator